MDVKNSISNERAVTLPVAGSLLPTTGLTALTVVQLRYVVKLLANLAKSTEQALRDRNPKLFDGNPGDFGCQRQALNIYELVSRTALLEECVLIKDETARLLERMRAVTSGRAKATAGDLRGMMATLRVPSRDLRYLLFCRLLASVRVKARVEKTGVIVTKSDPSALTRLCSDMSKVPSAYCKCIVNECQSRVSLIAVRMLRAQVRRLCSLSEESKRFVAARLSPLECVRYADTRGYPPKTFACLFYDMLTVLRRASEERIVVCVKSVEVGDTPRCGYLYQAAEPGGPFEELPSDRVVDELEPLIVIEGVISCDREIAGRCISAIGLEELALRGAARSRQLQPGSTVADLPNAAARSEVADYAERYPGVLEIDHIYTSTLKVENVRRIGQ